MLNRPPAGLVKFLKLLEAIDIPSTERDSVKTFVYFVENGEAKKLAEVLKGLYAKKGTTAAPTPVRTPTPPTTPPAPARAPAPGRPQPAQPQPSTGAAVLEGVAGDIEGDIVIDAYDDINALIIKASPQAYLTLLETIKKIDIHPKQVLIEVLVAEITLNDSTQLGVEWLLKTSIHAENQDLDVVGGFTGSNRIRFNTSERRFELPISENILSVPTGAFAAIIDPKRFIALITASAEAGNVNVLSSPHVLTVDNKEAKIEVGEEVPVATSFTQAGVDANNIGNSTSQVQFRSVGTILSVTPHINEKRRVTFKVSQEVSTPGRTVLIGR